jgi:type II secretory pathway pseudopilin PulG
MKPLPRNQRGPSNAIGVRGFALAETLVAAFLVGIVLVGVFPMISATTRGNSFDRNRINAANAARRKLEALRAVPFDNVGVGTSSTTPPYLGFFESNPAHAAFTSGEDQYYQDTFNLGNGIVATRAAIIQAVDDPIDGVGGADTDGRTLDYKQVIVNVDWTERGKSRRVSQTTILSGESTAALGGGGTAMDMKVKATKATGMGAMGKGVTSGADPLVPGGE